MDQLRGRTELSRLVAEKMRSFIIESSMVKGSRLPTEADLMELFGVGRSTVREAVKILQAENVVQVQRGQGTFIAEKTGQKNDPLGFVFSDPRTLIPSLMEARLLIEPGIAELAAARRTEADLTLLQNTLTSMEGAGHNDEYMRLDYRFHCLIAESTHNMVLDRILPLIHESIVIGSKLTSPVPESKLSASFWHRKMYDAILERDGTGARKAAEQHIHQTLADARNEPTDIHEKEEPA